MAAATGGGTGLNYHRGRHSSMDRSSQFARVSRFVIVCTFIFFKKLALCKLAATAYIS